jgi:hypothetical protein
MKTLLLNNFHTFTLMEEIWKTIPDFEDYQASNMGSVRSLKFGKKKILIQSITTHKKSGTYKQVKLRDKNGKSTSHKVHVLVYKAFVGVKGDSKYNIHHINRDSTDNRLVNLKLITHRQNCSIERTQKSGLPTGVYFSRNRFRSKIWIDGKDIYLGFFATPEEASQAYQNKLKEITNE